MTTDKLFTELFRPKSFKLTAMLSRVRASLTSQEQNLTQNILLYSTSGGTGKTTITRILTKNYDTMTINASAERGIDIIREKIQTFAGTYSINSAKKVKVIVLEEMDGLTSDSFDALRAVIERYADTVRFVGNCNNISKIPEPVQSRFLCIPLFPINTEEQNELFKTYCEYIKQILKHPSVDIKYTDEDIAELVRMYFPNMRTIMNKIQEVYNSGNKVLNIKTLASTFDCHELFEMILNPSTSNIDIYKFIVQKYGDNSDEVISAIAKEFLDYTHDYHPEYNDWIWYFATRIADYCRTINQTIDKQVHMLGLIGELLTITKEHNENS